MNEEDKSKTQPGVIRETIEKEVRTHAEWINWRCAAVTRSEEQHTHPSDLPGRGRTAIGQRSDAKESSPGPAVLRDQLYPVMIDNANRAAVLDQDGLVRPNAAEVFGKVFTEVIIPVLEEYHIVSRLGVFVADNAESTDTAIQAVPTKLRPDLDVLSRRAQYVGHIVNLAAKTFLFGQDVETFEQVVEAVTDDTGIDSKIMKDAQAAWRKKGAVAKFHNLIIFTRSSPQRIEILTISS